MDVQAAFNDGCQQIVGAVDVVIDGVALGGAALHRVGGRPLLGKVHDRVRALSDQQVN